MKWRTIRRETGLVEHVCEHGMGHPSRASALWRAEDWARRDVEDRGVDQERYLEAVEEHERVEMIHGCDGCCDHANFPGTYREGLVHAHGIMRTTHRLVREQDGHLRLLFDILKADTKTWWQKLFRRPA